MQAPLIPAPIASGVAPHQSKYQEPLNSATRDQAHATQLQQSQATSDPISGQGMKSGQKRRPNSYNEF
jgi:hypothetical protein